MPRPNHPTDAEYKRALDGEAHYRLKCLKVEQERDDLLTVLEGMVETAALRRILRAYIYNQDDLSAAMAHAYKLLQNDNQPST